jgi:hypothetical protein
MYLLFIWAGRNDFDVGNIHFEGHWKGWALKIETFLGPEMATSEAYKVKKIQNYLMLVYL